jgi:hypothetical protein
MVQIALTLSTAVGVTLCFLLGLGLGWRARGTPTRVVLCVLGIVVVLVTYTGSQALVGDPLMRMLAGIDSASGKTPYIVYWVAGSALAWVAYCLGVFRGRYEAA